jgi:hypothetical protein
MFRKAYAAPLAALALIAAAPVPSAALASNDDQRNASASQAGDDTSAKAERKTCKTFPDTVSRMHSKRLCLTQAQWREFNAAQQD